MRPTCGRESMHRNFTVIRRGSRWRAKAPAEIWRRAVSIMARERSKPLPAHQLLIYPVAATLK